ncbi:hypothetical protein RHP75_12335 [Pseudomonas sp. SG20056]|uniref:hypothetical protein n=1 Tax=Pseudomonas sp. SG20056 TaxID=3074146 RepID=UPI00287F9F69|nr:hypothetical protein [Pseudomonas sp. SG20056]WNF45175.1 hypothetical protein RHP75_12335 [Pseudomonas sp. SG20056]
MTEFYSSISSAIAPILSWMDSHSGIASWAQAVGSVVAILAAIAIASRQNRHLLTQVSRQKEEDVAKFYGAFSAYAMGALTPFGKIEQELKGENSIGFLLNNFPTESIERNLRTLDDFPVHSLLNYRSVTAALRVRERLHRLYATAQSLKAIAGRFVATDFSEKTLEFQAQLSAFETELRHFESQRESALGKIYDGHSTKRMR